MRIYKTRLHFANDGVTHPARGVVEMMRTLVTNLARLAPNEVIAVASGNRTAMFSIEATGEVIADFQFDHESRR